LGGLGDKAEAVLSAYMDRAVAGFIAVLTTTQRAFTTKPEYEDVLEIVSLAPVRFSGREIEPNRMGKHQRGAAYEYAKSLYAQDWFDSGTERDVANMLDNGN